MKQGIKKADSNGKETVISASYQEVTTPGGEGSSSGAPGEGSKSLAPLLGRGEKMALWFRSKRDFFHFQIPDTHLHISSLPYGNKGHKTQAEDMCPLAEIALVVTSCSEQQIKFVAQKYAASEESADYWTSPTYFQLSETVTKSNGTHKSYNIEEMSDVVSAMQEVDAYNSIWVHGISGKGRETTLIIACWLMAEKQMYPSEICSYFDSLKLGLNLSTDFKLFLNEYAARYHPEYTVLPPSLSTSRGPESQVDDGTNFNYQGTLCWQALMAASGQARKAEYTAAEIDLQDLDLLDRIKTQIAGRELSVKDGYILYELFNHDGIHPIQRCNGMVATRTSRIQKLVAKHPSLDFQLSFGRDVLAPLRALHTQYKEQAAAVDVTELTIELAHMGLAERPSHSARRA